MSRVWVQYFGFSLVEVFISFFSLLFSLHQPCSVFNLFLLCLGVFLCAVAPFEPVFTVAVWVKRAKYHGIILIKKKRTVKLMSDVDLRWFTLTDRPTSNLTAVLDGCMPDVVGIFDSGPEEEKTNTHTQPTKQKSNGINGGNNLYI